MIRKTTVTDIFLYYLSDFQSILAKLLPVCLPTVTRIVNQSLGNGQFCRDWKVAIVRPLIKNQNLDQVNQSYRPVSNLNFISKLVERCMLDQFNHHCTEFCLQPDYQSAYRSNYSTETALVKLTNNLLWAMENQKVTALTAMDLSAAFNTVDHDTLLSTPQNHFRITNDALKWFDEYLRPRSFRVCVNGKYSCEKDLSFSVPQGSCGGAVIDNAYASSLKDVIPGSLSINGYADDHT